MAARAEGVWGTERKGESIEKYRLVAIKQSGGHKVLRGEYS